MQLTYVGTQPSLIIAQGVGAADHTGNTTHTKVLSVPIPAGIMGLHGQLDIEVLWSNNNSGNNKTRRVYFSATDDLLGTAYSETSVTTTVASWFIHRVRNIGSVSSQQGAHALGSAGTYGSFAGAAITSSINTAALTYVVFSVELANSGDSCGIDWYRVALTRP